VILLQCANSEQATYLLNCPALDEEKKEALRLMRKILVGLAGPGSNFLEKMRVESERLSDFFAEN
jgi:hypothetical protein